MLPMKILSWNIEHFNGHGGVDRRNRAARARRVDDVVSLLVNEKPDVFGLSEVEGDIVYDAMTRKLPGYTFNITEGRQSQEILVGVRSGLTAFFTQRNEFKRSNPFLRPGALLTIRDGATHVSILFTHLKSMTSPEGFGLRDAMFEKVFKLKKQLDKASQALAGDDSALANFIVLGDMNTMGMDYFRSAHDISMEQEIKIVTARFKNRKMDALTKSHPFTFFNGSTSSLPPSNLDHVFAARHMVFTPATQTATVCVKGWAVESTARKKDKWIERFSDHAPLIFTLASV